MSTIFPREEKAEQIFDEILKNPHACERLKDTFFEAIPCFAAALACGGFTFLLGGGTIEMFCAFMGQDLEIFSDVN